MTMATGGFVCGKMNWKTTVSSGKMTGPPWPPVKILSLTCRPGTDKFCSAGKYHIELHTLGEADWNDIVLSLKTGTAEHLIEKSEIEMDPAGISFNLIIENGATLSMQSESAEVYLTGLTIEKI